MSKEEQRFAISADTVVRHAEGVLDGEMDDEVVLMSSANGEYYAMDRIGSRVWKLVATPRSLESVCRALCAEYDGSPGDVERDVLAFAAELLQKSLLRIEG